MNLKKLTVAFQEVDEFFDRINEALEKNQECLDSPGTLTFDSPETYRAFMTTQKLEILTAIARLKPTSVYRLAKEVGRKPQHVTSDCRSLEFHKFIKMTQSKKGRKQIRPELSFHYDVIFVNHENFPAIPISEDAEQILKDALKVG